MPAEVQHSQAEVAQMQWHQAQRQSAQRHAKTLSQLCAQETLDAELQRQFL